MVAFIRKDGELIPFATQEHADQWVAQDQARPQEPISAAQPMPDPTGMDAGQGRMPTPETAETPTGNSPDGRIRMRRGEEIWSFEANQRNQMLSAGYVEATDEDIAAAEEREKLKNPYGTSAAGRAAAKVQTAAEGVAAGVLSVPAAGINLIEGEAVTSGRDLLGGFYMAAQEAMGNKDVDVLQIEQGIRLRAKEHAISAIVGEAASYMAGGAGLARGAAGLAGRAGAGQGLGRAAGFAAEGAITGGLAGQEHAWIEDTEYTASDLMMHMGMGATFGAAFSTAPLAADKLKAVFGRGTGAMREAALGGEVDSWLSRKALDFAGAPTEALAARRMFEGQGLDPSRVVRGATGLEADAQIMAAQKALLNITNDAGQPVVQIGLGKQHQTARNMAARREEIKNATPDVLGNGQAPWQKTKDDLVEALSSREFAILQSTDEALAGRIKARITNMLTKEQQALLEKAGKPTGLFDAKNNPIMHPHPPTESWTVPVKVLQEQKEYLIGIAKGAGASQGAAISRIVDKLEDGMSLNAASKDRYVRNLQDDKLLRTMQPETRAMLAKGSAELDVTMAGAGARIGIGYLMKAWGVHNIAAGGAIVGGTREAIQAQKNHLFANMIAKRYYKQTAAFNTVTDAAAAKAVKGAAGVAGQAKRFSARAFDVTAATGGYVSKKFYRGTTPAIVARFVEDGESPEDAFARHQDELMQVNDNPDAMMQAVAGRLGPAAELHPNLTMETMLMPFNGARHLLEHAPGNPPINALAPNVKGPPPSRGEIATYARRWNAVMNPYDVVDELANGQLTQESVQAIEAVYPGFYNKLKDATLGAIGNTTEPMPFEVRQQMEIMLQMPGSLVKANAPDFQMRFTQTAMIAAMGEEGGGGGGGGGTPGSNGKQGSNKGSPTLAQQMQSPVDRAVENIHN